MKLISNPTLTDVTVLPKGTAFPTGTVTFLFTDIEGSTPLWEQHPDQMAVALQIHNSILRKAIESQGGIVFKIVGDSFQAAFATAPQALRAAIEGQKALQSAPWNELGPLKVRMGLHTGEAELDPNGDEYAVSHTKNRASRIMSAAHGGQILLTQETKVLVDHQLPEGVMLKDLGEHRLKGITIPERLFQVSASGLAQVFPPLETAILYPNNLPIQLTSFIGREHEIETVCDLLKEHRLVTLTGSGGTGKTRLSLQVAGLILESYPNGAWLVELAPLADPALVPNTIATALNLPEMPGKPISNSLVDFLQPKRLLLILDNCEHLLDACTHLADLLLRSCPELTILASSREFLGVKGEIPYRVPPMALPDPRHLPSFLQLCELDAVRLFVERARVVSPGFAASEKNAATIAQVVTRLDGIPLAIELAASRIRMLTIEQVAQRLDDAFRLLTGGSRTVLPRHQTLRALIDWSYNLLSEPERILLRRLSVFAGGWTVEAAEKICAHEMEDCQPLCPEDLFNLLAGLVDKSLIYPVSGTEQINRFKMLETIRQYAHEKLVDEREAEALRARHLAFYLAWVETLEPRIRGREQVETLESLELELDNLRLALEWGLQTEPEAELRLASALKWFWQIRSRYSEGIHWLEQGLDQLESKSGNIPSEKHQRTNHAKAHEALGYLYRINYQVNMLNPSYLNLAIDSLNISLLIYRTAGQEESPTISIETQRGTAWALLSLGACLQGTENPDFKQAEEMIQEAQGLFYRTGDALGIAESLQVIREKENDPAEKKKIFHQRLAIFETSDDVEGMASAQFDIGFASIIDGDYQNAHTAFESCLVNYQKVNHLDMVINAWVFSGITAHCLGEMERASQCYSHALSVCRDLGSDAQAAVCYYFEWYVAIAQGYLDRAVDLNNEAWEIYQKTPRSRGKADVLHMRARLSRLFGDQQAARMHAEELYNNAPMPNQRMLALLEMGCLALESGDIVQAGSYWREGIQIIYQGGETNWLVIPLVYMAHLACLQEQMERAALLFGTRWGRAGFHFLSPGDRTRHTSCLENVRIALGETRFEQLFEEGHSISLEQAIALALETAVD